MVVGLAKGELAGGRVAVRVVAATETTDLGSELPLARTLTVADVTGLVEELAAYHAHFAPCFRRSEQRGWAEVYLRGLLVADVPRKNVEAMALRLLGAGVGAELRVRGLQQFIGEGGWDDAAILAQHQVLVEETLGEADGVLIVDGSDIPKRGTHSAGVARQWCGAVGKSANCQAGIFLGYASRQGYTLLDRRLCLHASWFTPAYRARRLACGIPEGTGYVSKGDLAAEMVEQVVTAGRLRADWVVCDEGFARDSAFLDRLAATGLRYLAEVPRDRRVWPLVDPADGQTPRTRPTTWAPPRKPSGTGRRPTALQLHPDSPPSLRLDDLAGSLPALVWRRYRLREGSRGPLLADFAAVRVVTVRAMLPGPEVWLLIRRPLTDQGTAADPTDWQYLLSNAPADTPLATLVRVCGMRWPIEWCFAEGKGEVGLDHYELRFWRGWYHHMTLVILAHHFLVRMAHHLDQRGGGLSASDRPTAPAPASRPGRLPGRPGGGRSPSRPTTRTAAPPHLAPGRPPAARRAPPAALRSPRGAGSHHLLPTPQPGRLLQPPRPHPPDPRRAKPLIYLSLS